MERKLVQMGKHTLMAAIPSKWIKRHNLQKGDQFTTTSRLCLDIAEQYLSGKINGGGKFYHHLTSSFLR